MAGWIIGAMLCVGLIYWAFEMLISGCKYRTIPGEDGDYD